MPCAACSPTSGGSTARAEVGQALSLWQACSPTSGGATARAEVGQALLSWQACSPSPAAQRHAQRLAKRLNHGKLAAPRLAAQRARAEVGQALLSWQACSPSPAAQRHAQRLAKRLNHGKLAAPRLAAQRHAQRLAKRCMACAACSPTSGGSTARSEVGQALLSWQACSPTSGGSTAHTEVGQAQHGTCKLAAPRLAAQRHAQRLAKRSHYCTQMHCYQYTANMQARKNRYVRQNASTRKAGPPCPRVMPLVRHAGNRLKINAVQARAASQTVVASINAQIGFCASCLLAAHSPLSDRSIPGRPRRPRVAPGLSKQRAPSKQR